MPQPIVWLLSLIRIVRSLPDLSDKDGLRKWLSGLLESAAGLAAATANHFDDVAVAALQAGVKNDMSWDLLYSLISKLAADHTVVGASFDTAQDEAQAFLESIPSEALSYQFLNPAVILEIIMAVIALLKSLRA